VDEVFSELSSEPLGAASLAQCHKGVLRDGGEVVAVKIQHPDVHTNAYTDMDSMQVRMTIGLYL
jgi:aarF domain-containing kinase